jgi:hypothetical protein
VRQCANDALTLLKERWDLVDSIATALIQRGSLSERDIAKLFKEHQQCSPS